MPLSRAIVAFILLTLPAAVIASPAGADLNVTAHISRADVRKVLDTVAHVTRQPVTAIAGMSTEKYIRGAFAYETIIISGKGRRKATMYEIPDRVSVETRFEEAKNGGDVYILHKVGNRWKIVSKGDWER